MARVRVSTTVDERLLSEARSIHEGSTDASLLEAALEALLATHRRTAVDEAYRLGYAAHPVDDADAWGDLVSFSAAAHEARR